MKKNIFTLFFMVCIISQSMADGKMYWSEKVPPKIPYQRALITFENETQTLVLQSRYEIPQKETPLPLGWVVPVPAVPELASMNADSAKYMFRHLSANSSPTVIEIPVVLFVIFFGSSILTFLLCALSFIVPFPAWFKSRRDIIAKVTYNCILLCFLIGLLFGSLLSAGGSFGVDIISEQRVGIYDVHIVKSDNSNDLISWLNSQKFNFNEKDKGSFDKYISQGWCFVVAKINPEEGRKEQEIVSQGLAAPLILRFPCKRPVYPVALTGTGGHDTEILIYLASETKMICDDKRMTLRFAGAFNKSVLDYSKTEPINLIKTGNLNYLCKFKDKLTPAQMSSDITFSPAKDKETYREYVFRW